MDILASVLIGALAGGLIILVTKSGRGGPMAPLAVGILGALLGLTTHIWIGSSSLIGVESCQYTASVTGTVLSLLLWAVAQRLFLSTPTRAGHD